MIIEKAECVSVRQSIRVTIYSLPNNKIRFLNSFYYMRTKDELLKIIDKTVKEIMSKLENKITSFL